ncbi:hypothetical protein JM84_2582 [Dokdonia sp. Hel_I_63]|uniref:hypothetical protein n=1 Tax=unclassified Dokdonia TaxID=2615033 RepID=UPI00020A6869|nr:MULTISPECIES: hypothetical protein [unclassified Dokdonia]AEE20108.1 hypothetical protein Krodi_2126 [Dokdonia sp. 4H-3-7-5]TVZ23638.1 hypothetical protein JM84_2582 [Dokdonia sp. Hel_I_63]
MKKLTLLLALIFFIVSCDDGDVIVTQLDFDDVELQLCENVGNVSNYVFYKTKSSTNEALALQFETDEPIFTEVNTSYSVLLSGTDQYSYRVFNGDPSNYFCNAIPPTSPVVQEEFISTDGLVEIFTRGTESDADFIPTEIEDPTLLLDTDLDGILDYLDFDDDGDNVPTRLEGVVLNEDETAIDLELSRDTDGDMIPDYLDDDDDGDGILTRNEDLDRDLNPNNDKSDLDFPTVPDYLNPEVAVETIVNVYREHEYFITDLTLDITITNTVLVNPVNQEELRDQTLQLLGTYSSSDVSVTVTPEFN